MSGQDDGRTGSDQERAKPGDQAPPGTPGSGQNVCRHCGGSGRMQDGSLCTVCDGTGTVNEELGGG